MTKWDSFQAYKANSMFENWSILIHHVNRLIKKIKMIISIAAEKYLTKYMKIGA